MKSVIRLAIVDPNDVTRHALKTLLLGIDTVWLEAECSRYDVFNDVLLQTQPDIALVALDSDQNRGIELIGSIHQNHPACQILAISSHQEGSLILQAVRNGAKEFLTSPLKLEEFLGALERIRQVVNKNAGEGGPTRASQIISVAGVSGGIGCTSLAINLGCSFAQKPGCSVAVIDLDLALGDADVWLDIIPDYTIQDVADNINRLDYALLKRSLTKHDCGAFLLPRPVEMEDHPPIGPDELRRVISLLKATFTHLVIDLSKTFTPLDQAAMELSDVILIVTQLDLPSLRNAVRLMQYFKRKQGLYDKVKVVVNRMGLDENTISLNKALETLGREIFATIPNDYATMVEARNNGVPLITQAPKARVTKSILQLVQSLDGPAEVEEKTEDKKAPRKGGLFSFLGSGGR
ncbi:MAG: response regulator [Planctomycetes bacterium]|nr:response regulator [Planctomycetota bacterium]